MRWIQSRGNWLLPPLLMMAEDSASYALPNSLAAKLPTQLNLNLRCKRSYSFFNPVLHLIPFLTPLFVWLFFCRFGSFPPCKPSFLLGEPPSPTWGASLPYLGSLPPLLEAPTSQLPQGALLLPPPTSPRELSSSHLPPPPGSSPPPTSQLPQGAPLAPPVGSRESHLPSPYSQLPKLRSQKRFRFSCKRSLQELRSPKPKPWEGVPISL